MNRLNHTDVAAVARLLSGRRVAVLTGAGCSTESGIPDYRGPETLRRARNPIKFNQFVGDPAWRRRYWARSFTGWPRIRDAQPNPAHHALARLEQGGVLTGVITQNVDRLHHKAGSTEVVELHGALAEVVCLSCGAVVSRGEHQARLAAENPGWTADTAAETAPDGDAELTDTHGFSAPDCALCGGPLKPHVVFFGENVPRGRVEASTALVDDAEALLVVGSSLTVFSGFRFVKKAHQNGIPVAIVNLGPSRGDPLAAVRLEARAGEALPELASLLGC